MSVVKARATAQFIDDSFRKRSKSFGVLYQGDNTLDENVESAVELAANMDIMSKCAIRGVTLSMKDDNSTLYSPPISDSEVGDTLRLQFVNAKLDAVNFDVPDAHDNLFQSSTGQGKNIMVEYDDLSAVLTSNIAAKDLIDAILGGDILISDEDTIIAYKGGYRL